ncbi:MAG: hypothetical protein K2H14_02645 [Muribaculaceae bacterium]|nr:hypothetical protein [Muribaculaceae bacterium]
MGKDSETGNPFKVIIIAVGVLVALSALPWGKMTGNFLKDYNLFEDLLGHSPRGASGGGELVDPELEAALAEMPVAAPHPDGQEVAADATPDDIPAAEPDTAAVAPRHDGMVGIEDYTPASSGLSRFAAALGEGRLARVAIIGDSYIEGDVFSQNIREGLQELYGGHGAGFLALHSDIPGFRQSVRQSDSGWTLHDLRKDKRVYGRWLGGVFSTSGAGAAASFSGVGKLAHAGEWSRATLLFIAPSDGVIVIDPGSGPVEHAVTASDKVQSIVVSEPMKKIKIENRSVDGLVALGLWLDDDRGVGVDCMSLRGNSGVALRKLDSTLTAGMRSVIDYDLIVVEYGLNAISSDQTDYTSYGRLMEQVIRGIMENYPNADILIMGVGDRGQKAGSSVHSLDAVKHMVSEQRSLARRLGVLFWDTREAMGGTDAVVAWRENGWINADYIHLNHKGGAELASRFVEAVSHSVGAGE